MSKTFRIHTNILIGICFWGWSVCLLSQSTPQAPEALVEAGESFFKEGDFEGAINAFRQAEALYATQQPGPGQIRALLGQAKSADMMYDLDDCLAAVNKAIGLTKKYLKTDDLLTGKAFRQKAEAMMQTEHLDSAKYFLELSLPIFEAHDEWAEVCWSRILIAVNYLNESYLTESVSQLEALEEVLNTQEIPPVDLSDIESTMLSLYGVAYELQNDYQKAIIYTDRALQKELAKPVLARVDSTYVAGYYKNLGTFYFAKGDYTRAKDNYSLAVVYDSRSFDHDEVINYNLGNLYLNLGEYPLAIEYFNRSLQWFSTDEQNSGNIRNALNGLAVTYREGGDYAKALAYCRESLELAGDDQKYASYAIMGNMYTHLEQPEQALFSLEKAKTFYQRDSFAQRESPVFGSELFRLMGDANLLAQKPEKALANYQMALIAVHSSFNDSLNYKANPNLSDVYEPIYFLKALQGKAKALARLEDQQGQWEASLVCYELVMDWIDTLQVSYASEAAQLSWSSEFKTIYEEAIGAALQLYQARQDPSYLDMAFAFSEKSKNAILLERLKASEGRSYAGIPAALLQQEKDLELDMAFYTKSIRSAREAKDTEQLNLYEQYLSQTRLELVELQEILAKDYPKYRDLKYGGDSPTIADIQDRLTDDGSAFLSYFLGSERAYVFVITQDNAELVVLPPTLDIHESTIAFHRELLDVNGFRTDALLAFEKYNRVSFDLYTDIFEPVLDFLPTEVNRILVAPDGVLTTVPFAALTTVLAREQNIDFSHLAYLLHNYSFQYAYSASLQLKSLERREQLAANKSCLAMAPPYKGLELVGRSAQSQTRNAGRLEGTAQEIQEIAKFMEGEFDYSSSATERNFKELASEFGILHLAMHGVADMEDPNFNHLKFSDLNIAATDTTEDNLLYHYEIANLDLSAQLVVLSACETGVGKYEEGEGVFSLARSFSYAGVPSVVMSLWQVNDLSTSELMPLFYASLTEGASKDAALKKAKENFLQSASLEFRHPFYWAAFVGLGDSSPISQPNSIWLWGGLTAIFAGGLLFWLLRARLN